MSDTYPEIGRAIRGLCQTCNMAGLIRERDVPWTGPRSLDGTANDIQTAMQCVTCFETPLGVFTQNQTHKRLPKEEYR